VTDGASSSTVAAEELLDAAPCGFVSFADDGAILIANRALLEMTGYAREELIGRPFETILTIAGRIFHQTHFFPLLRLHGHAEEIFLLLRRRDGGDLGALVNAIRRERGGIAVTDCVLLVVRERRKFEDALLRAKREAEDARAALERRTAELERTNARLEAQAEELERQQRQLEEQAAEMEAAGEELRVLNDELVARSAELERQRETADEANRAKSAFLAVMSHELRTPLNAIGGYVQLIELGIHGPVTPGQEEALSRISRSQRHLLRLINDVLNLARIESGRVEYAIEDVPLAAVVAAVEPMIAPQLETKALRWECRVPASLVARADREKVQQVLINLLGNAVKFTPDGGRIVVEAAPGADAAGAVQITVADTGLGIPAEKLESIFQPFVQVDASHTRVAEGSGLGLSISRDLARGMGGELTVRSTIGEGSAFTLRLPAASPASVPARGAS
jgi:PAS domain S-box-containing protein